MKEVKYQQKYIKKVADTALDFFQDKYQTNNAIILQAPTGSGKTYMISQALSIIAKQSKEPLSFIWISVNSLHEQSRQNLTRYLDDEKLLECITIEDIKNVNVI